MKKLLTAVAATMILAGCGASGPPTEEDLIEACREARIGTMAADADPKNLGEHWPADFEYTELKNGTYSAKWNEASTLFYTCDVTWEDGEATSVDLSYVTP